MRCWDPAGIRTGSSQTGGNQSYSQTHRETGGNKNKKEPAPDPDKTKHHANKKHESHKDGERLGKSARTGLSESAKGIGIPIRVTKSENEMTHTRQINK